MASQGISTREAAPVEVPGELRSQFHTALAELGGGPVRKGTGLAVQILCAIDNRGVALPSQIEAIVTFLNTRAREVLFTLDGKRVDADAKAEVALA